MLHYLMDRTSASGGVILDRLKLKIPIAVAG